jgi:hypothetical protein
MEKKGLLAGNSGTSIRNESYLKATNDSLNDSSAFSEPRPMSGAFRSLAKSFSSLAPTVGGGREDDILIEDEDYSRSPSVSILDFLFYVYTFTNTSRPNTSHKENLILEVLHFQNVIYSYVLSG